MIRLPSSRRTVEPLSHQAVGPSSRQAAQPSSFTATTMPSTAKQAETTAYKNVQSNLFTRVLAEMVAQIKLLTAAVTQLVATKENSNPNATRGNGGGHRQSRRPQMNNLRNMGGYCSSHVFYPVGAGHNSKTCRWQKEEHNMEATWNNRLGGNMFWPTATRVAIEQQDHPT